LQPQVRQQELLLEQESPLLALQKAVAEHRLLAQVCLEPYSGSQLHFQTYTIDRRLLGQHKPFWLLPSLLLQPVLELVQVTLQILQLQ
jgi:hypothetical protein